MFTLYPSTYISRSTGRTPTQQQREDKRTKDKLYKAINERYY